MRRGPSRRARQRGITLVIALLMLMIIGLASVGVMHNVRQGEQVAQAGRLRAQAAVAAQAALDFCVAQLSQPTPVMAVLPASQPEAWTDASRWREGGPPGVYRLRAGTDLAAGTVPGPQPQCLAEQDPLDGLYRVTARGFSADFIADAQGHGRAGAQVWLQAEVLAPGPERAVLRRTWLQLLVPPL